MTRRKFAILLTLFGLTLAPREARGQKTLDPGQLPKTTTFFLAWHGMPAGDARKNNSLLALWDDPDFAPVRSALLEQIEHGSARSQKASKPVTPEEFTEFAGLLDNELVLGAIEEPSPAKVSKGATVTAAHKWEGAFLVYDRTGKDVTLAKLLARTRGDEKDPPKISSESVAGIPAIKVERTSGVSYWAESGKYTFSASEPAVFEQIAAWTKQTEGGPAGLSETETYREASELLKGGVLNFFFHLPSIGEMAGETSAAGFRLRPLLQNVRMDAVHLIAGNVSLSGARTRTQIAVLGDTEPGTPFDIWTDGSGESAAGAFVDSNTISYQQGKIDLMGVFGLVKRALQSTAAAGQQGPMDFIEIGAQSRLGMTIPEALGLFTGEFASTQANPALDPAKRVFIAGIHEKPGTLKLLRAALADRVTSERNEGDVTFLKVSEGGIHNSAGTASWKYYQVAVTADAILVSSRLESLKEILARRSASVANAQMPASWQTARGQFPKSLNGLGFVDFQKIDWTAAKARWDAESLKAGTTSRSSTSSRTDVFSNSLKKLDPQIFPRHLHLSATASWKDTQGLHFDGWIE